MQLCADDAVSAMMYERQNRTSGANTHRGSVNLAKIRLASKMQEFVLRRNDMRTEISKKLTTALDKLQAVADDANSPMMKAASDSIIEGKQYHEQARIFLDQAVEADIKEIVEYINGIETDDHVEQSKKKIAAINKNLTTGPVKVYFDWCKKVNMTSVALRRKTEKPHVRQTAEAMERPKHPMYVALVTGIDDEKINTCISVYEAKAGVRGCTLKVSSDEVFKALSKNASVKRICI